MLKTGAVSTALNLGREGNMIGNPADPKRVTTDAETGFLVFEHCPSCGSQTDNGIAQCDEPLTAEFAARVDESSELVAVGVGG